jgi:hypothetical protein
MSPTAAPRPVVPAKDEQVRALCSDCHAYPPPDTFPKSKWYDEVHRCFQLFNQAHKTMPALSEWAVTEYYREHAPEALATLGPTPDSTPPVSFERLPLSGPEKGEPSAISNVRAVLLSDTARPDILACDMVWGFLWARKAGDTSDRMTKVADDLGRPAHMEVVDLDSDGLRDLLVADLGMPVPTDILRGRVLWLRARLLGGFETIELASQLGRVSDVRPADFDGDGDLDLVVAVSGWRNTGEILLLENQGKNDVGEPRFKSRTLDRRRGTINVPVADLDGDGRPDFVALISQESEAVVAFHNEGEGRFTPVTLFEADHPAFGSTSIDLADLDGDGDLDAVLANGDFYGSPLLRPYHGVSWLENKGWGGRFERHELGAMYGAHRARVVDLDGDGDLDVVACAFLGGAAYAAARQASQADAVVLFEQVGPGRFVRHALERVTADYPSFDVGDVDGDGRVDLVLGRFQEFRMLGDPWRLKDRTRTDIDPVVVWRNLGPGRHDE